MVDIILLNKDSVLNGSGVYYFRTEHVGQRVIKQ